MTTVNEQIQNVDRAICQNIKSLAGQRDLLSQNILSHLRNLVESVAVLLHANSPHVEFNYAAINPALSFVKSKAKLNFLGKFHKLIEKSASHYTLDGDSSERLMIKYYEYLYRIRSLLYSTCRMAVLENLEEFPVDLDPSLREYHEKIVARINAVRVLTSGQNFRERYYIHKTRPFFMGGKIYYEVTFYRAINKVSKFDRIIAFTEIDMTDKYAAMLTLHRDSIEVLGRTMPIMIITGWEVSIRPCEFKNFGRLLGIDISVNTSSKEYRYLMNGLTVGMGNLLDLFELSDSDYARVKTNATSGVTKPQIFIMLDRVRDIVRSKAPGNNILRYLILRMYNQILKAQFSPDCCKRLSDLKMKYGCIPFDDMPFCTSLPGHNPRYWDLIESLDPTNRNHELLARCVKNNVDRHGILYTPVKELERFGDINALLSIYNGKIYHTHAARRLVHDKDHVFICGHEDDTVAIVNELQKYASAGIAGYTQAVERWLGEGHRMIDDPVKLESFKQLFSQSHVVLIYGAAGTGKSTMVDHIAHYFNDKDKLFLAHTNPAIDNLKRKVTSQNSSFRTISSHISRKSSDPNYDILIVDECSTVSNADLIQVLRKTRFKLLVLVGDVYQIESIQFGNWFSIISSFIPSTSVFELTTPFRTKSDSLLSFWNSVRSISDDIAEIMARNGYTTVLDKNLFDVRGRDEIILCLNYDGLYGINNINRFLQSSNPAAETSWRMSTYKIGDPVLFHETERFRPVIYNNLKGRIVEIQQISDGIQFDIELDRPLNEFDVDGIADLQWIEGSTVRFCVYDHEASDEDDDSLNTTVPFQVAYAVSIHKAQGLEYDSVKIVITDANDDDVTHSIFYTAITRARDRLLVFWTPETQQRVLERLRRISNPKDISLLVARRGLIPVGN